MKDATLLLKVLVGLAVLFGFSGIAHQYTYPNSIQTIILMLCSVSCAIFALMEGLSLWLHNDQNKTKRVE